MAAKPTGNQSQARLGGESTPGYKLDGQKPMMDRLPTKALVGAARAFTDGHFRYDEDQDGNLQNEIYRNNWREGMRWGRIYSASQRHMDAWYRGEDYDSKSGLLHIDHAMACLMMLREYYDSFPQGDDRPAMGVHTRLNVVLDIDGVIADFNGAFLDHCLSKGLIDEAQYLQNRETTSWNYQFAFEDEFKNLSDEFWMSIKPLCTPDSFPFEPIAYLTHRRVDRAVTEAWLNRHGFPKRPVYSTAGSKAELAHFIVQRMKDGGLHGPAIFVDDKYENFQELSEAGFFCYLIDRSHNRRYNVGHRRIFSLSEIGNRPT